MALSRQVDAVDDDGALLQGSSLQRIPELEFNLNDKGQIAYLKWAQMLFERGLLTDITREYVVAFALAEHDLDRALAKSAGTRYQRDARNSAFKKLTKLYGSSSATTSTAAKNLYARFGFARRARQRRHDQD